MSAGRLTIEKLCREYLDRAGRGLILTRRGEAKSKATLYTDTGRIDRHIVPLIGKRTVKDLTATTRRFSGRHGRQDHSRRQDQVRGRAIVTGGKGTAARTLDCSGGISRFRRQRGLQG